MIRRLSNIYCSRGLIVLAVLFLTTSCRKDPVVEEFIDEPVIEEEEETLKTPVLPEEPYDYEARVYPDYFLEDPLLNLLNTLGGSNQVTNNGATVGRVMFYDTQLSFNNTVSCASCHHQELGFSDNRVLSLGFEGELSERHSMAILNIDFQRRFFWDTRANSIESQVLMPIEHPLEMGMDLDSLVYRMQRIDYYPSLFEAAFGDTAITITRIGLGLGQFLKAIRSYESKYDAGLANDFADFTPLEEEGRALFFSGVHSCVNCHTTVNFGGVSSHVNGLNAGGEGDPGVGGITEDPEDMGRFKSVTLRNIELTAPYMHDGRFETLEDVLSFYSTDIQSHPFLDDRLTTDNSIGGPPEILDITPAEKAAYIAFLKTLTDWNLVENVIYSNPFPE